MTDRQKNNLQRMAVKEFWKAVDMNASVEELAGIIKKYPNMLSSKEFMRKAFPKDSTSAQKLGQVSFNKTLKLMQKMKNMEAVGLISAEQLNAFLNGKHPVTGDSFATLVSKHAVAAYDKAHIDRSPKANLSDKARQAFSQQADYYRETLKQMRELGVPLNEKDDNGNNIRTVAQMGKVNDSHGLSAALSGQQPDVAHSTALRIRATEDEDALEVGNGDALKVTVKEKDKPALKVKTQPAPTEEPINEATVEDAPEEDKGKRGDYQGDKIREQDIIDYMYNEWFLAGLSWCINKVSGSIINGVDNLCENYKRNNARNLKKKEDNQRKDVKDFQARGNDILRHTPQQMSNQFVSGLEGKNNFVAKLNKDILANVGKNPQQWSVLNPQKASHAQMIQKINAAYAQNPTEFTQQLKSMETHGSQQKNLIGRVYSLAVQQATVQYMAKKMQGKDTDFVSMDTPIIQAEISKLADKNYKSLISGINGVAEHIGLASELRDGETKKDVIDENKAHGVEMFLQMNEHQTAKAKAALMDDLEEGRFKIAGEKLPKQTKGEIIKMTQLLADGEKQWDVLMPEKRKENGMEDLASAAARINTEDIRQNKAINEVTRNLDSINSQLADNAERKKPITERRKQYVEALKKNSSFKDYDNAAKNQKNTELNVGRIIIESRKQHG